MIVISYINFVSFLPSTIIHTNMIELRNILTGSELLIEVGKETYFQRSSLSMERLNSILVAVLNCLIEKFFFWARSSHDDSDTILKASADEKGNEGERWNNFFQET